MQVILQNKLEQFYTKHPDAKANLLTWNKRASLAKWQNSNEICQSFKPGAVDKVGKFIIFDICGKKYRLIAYIDDYASQQIYLSEFLTHANYSKDKWKHD
ncbi:MAG: type II toxin-antitoxin system HigB family toxin [Nostoc sp.]